MNFTARYCRVLVVLLAVAGGGAFFGQRAQASQGEVPSACADILALPALSPDHTRPAQLKLLNFWLSADRDCIERVVKKFGRDAYSLSMKVERPSDAIDIVPDKIILEFWGSAILWGGDRANFVSDVALVSALERIYERSTGNDQQMAAQVHDFILGSQRPDIARKFKPYDQKLYAASALIDNVNDEELRPYCEKSDCGLSGVAQEFCQFADFAALKIAYRQDKEALMKRIFQCPIKAPDSDTIRDLRFIGILSGFCPMGTQVTYIWNKEFSERATCEALMSDLPTEGTFGSDNVLQYIRLLREPAWRARLSRQQLIDNAKTIRELWKWDVTPALLGVEG